MSSLEDIYRDFGQEVINEVQRQITDNGSLAPLLKRLGVPSLPGVMDQHSALCGFIYRYGIGFFMQVAKSHMTYEEIDRRKLEVLLSFRAKAGRTSGRVIPPSASPSASAKPVPEPPKRTQQQPGAPMAPVSLGGQAAPKPSEPSRHIHTATYDGPDRRVLADRRVNNRDRRARVATIWFPNRRFGGDRRRTVRREEDRQKLGKTA